MDFKTLKNHNSGTTQNILLKFSCAESLTQNLGLHTQKNSSITIQVSELCGTGNNDCITLYIAGLMRSPAENIMQLKITWLAMT